jgi:hypothetical protein
VGVSKDGPAAGVGATLDASSSQLPPPRKGFQPLEVATHKSLFLRA